MRERLRRLLAPPRFADLETDRIARAAHTLALVFIGVGLLWTPLAATQYEDPRPTWFFGPVTLVLLVGIAALARRGRPHLAAALLVAMIFVVSGVAVWQAGGVQTPAATFFAVTALAAVLLLPPLGATAVTVASALTLVFLAWAGQRGLLAEPLAATPWRALGGHLAILGVVVGLARIATSRLREAQRFLNQVADATPHGLYVYDLRDRRLVYVNASAPRQVGYTAPLPPHHHDLRGLLHPEDRDRVLARSEERSRLPDDAVLAMEYRVRGGDGRWRWLREQSRIFERDADGAPRRIVGAVMDVTDTREIQDSLRESEARFRALAEEAPDLVTELDAEGRIAWANAAHARCLGGPVERFLGRRPVEFVHPDDRPAAEAARQTLIDTGRAQGTWRMLHADGSSRWFEYEATAFTGADGGTRVIAVGRDVTERLKLLARLQRAERMEALGQLAGGVAHDFNNYLTVILGSVEQIAEAPADAAGVAEAARAASLAAQRSADLTRRLLDFSRRRLLRPRVLDPGEVLATLEPLLRRLVPDDVHLDVLRGAAGSRVRIDPSQLEQVVVNLAVNARDAMPGGGRLAVETRDVELDGSEGIEVPPGPYVAIQVSDTGAGMSEETRRRLFEPLFTTKEAGEGTGLGLATVDGIVRGAGGVIELRSAPGRGTCFRVFLPRVDAPADAPPAAAEAETAPVHGRVLLVEDQPEVRRFARRALERAGYAVTEVPDAPSALEIFRPRPDDFDVLLTDVSLPGPSGLDLADSVRALRADLPVLYTSGFTADALAGRGLGPKEHLLDKPFTARDLVRRLAEVIEAAHPDRHGPPPGPGA